MIQVKKLNEKKYFLNALYIESVEANPDTTITMTNGKKLIVATSESEIIQSIYQFYRSINVLGMERDQEDSDEE